MTVRMRHTRGHTRNRRSHHKVDDIRFSTCAKCKEFHIRHKMCENCGTYRGKEVVDVARREAKKAEKEKKAQT